MWLCKCDCGKEITTLEYLLRSGCTKSCGCYASEVHRKLHETHGQQGKEARIYNIWTDMKGRCNNPNNKDYKHYGARGITTCKEWNKLEIFATKSADVVTSWSASPLWSYILPQQISICELTGTYTQSTSQGLTLNWQPPFGQNSAFQ